MPTVRYQDGTDYPRLPEGEAVLMRVIESEYKTEDNPFYGKPTGRKDDDGEPIIDNREERDVVAVVLEAVDADYAGTRAWKKFSASIAEKSHLRPFIQACSPQKLTLDELKKYDTDDLVGAYVWVVGEYNDARDPEHKYLRPTSFMRVKSQDIPKKRKPAPKPDPDDDDDDDRLARARKARRVADDEEDEPKPKKKAAPVDDDEDEPKPKKRKPAPVDDDEDEPKPKKKAPAFDPDDDPF